MGTGLRDMKEYWFGENAVLWGMLQTNSPADRKKFPVLSGRSGRPFGGMDGVRMACGCIGF